MVSDECRYTKTHEWVKIDGSLAVVGISDYAQEALGDITFVELPTLGTKLSRGEECGVIESVKAASDLYAPISGEVVEVNESLETEPEKINQDPYIEGWMFKLEDFEEHEYKRLMNASAYEKFLEKEE